MRSEEAKVSVSFDELPKPFPDICVDRRTVEQARADQPASASQVAWHDESVPSSAYDSLVRRLNARRTTVPQAVQLDLLRTEYDRRTIVANAEVLVDLQSGEADLTTISSILSEAGLTSGRVPLAGALDNRLVRLTVASTRQDVSGIQAADQAIAALRQKNLTADYNYVSTFQQGPTPASGTVGHDVVVKDESGPFPTTVADNALYLSDGQRSPEESITVAVIDTGITSQHRGDGWLTGILSPTNIDPLDVYPTLGYLDFAAGHGTFAAGVIQSIEPQATVLMYNPLDSDGFGTLADVAAAMVDAATQGAKVINLSLGVRTVDGTPPDAFTVAIDMINAMFADPNDRPVLVAAAGNFGDDVPTFPAACPGVVSVASLAADGAPSTWSSRGSWVTFSTVGEGVVSTYVDGTTDSAFGGQSHTFPAGGVGDPWAIWTGTSFAAPQISAAIVRTMRTQNVSAQAACRALLALPGPTIPNFGKPLLLLPGTA